MKVAAWVGMLAALACIDCLAEMVRHQESTGASPAKLERMPEALEVEFALSALARVGPDPRRGCNPVDAQ